MNEENQEREEERIETHNNRRFKMRGTRPVAFEQACPHCHQQYWQPVVQVGADPTVLGHTCQPARLGGASVINKYG